MDILTPEARKWLDAPEVQRAINDLLDGTIDHITHDGRTLRRVDATPVDRCVWTVGEATCDRCPSCSTNPEVDGFLTVQTSGWQFCPYCGKPIEVQG